MPEIKKTTVEFDFERTGWLPFSLPHLKLKGRHITSEMTGTFTTEDGDLVWEPSFLDMDLSQTFLHEKDNLAFDYSMDVFLSFMTTLDKYAFYTIDWTLRSYVGQAFNKYLISSLVE